MFAQIDREYLKIRPRKMWARLIAYFFFEGRPLTTKGRWINGIVFFFFRIQKVFPKLKKIESPIYILGTGRSGTTILGVVLSMHRDIGFLNEPKAIWNSAFPEEDIIGSYSKKPGRYFLQKEDASENIKSDLNKIYGAYLRISFSKRILDKYPELIFRMPFLLKLFPDSKCVFLVRNGWDTVSSIENWSDRKGSESINGSENWWGLNNRKWLALKDQVLKKDEYYESIWPILDELSSHKDFAALEWVATMREGFAMKNRYPENIHVTFYEQLVNNPIQELETIAKFSNLSHDKKMFEYAKDSLSPVKKKKPILINPQIVPLFEETMKMAGYK